MGGREQRPGASNKLALPKLEQLGDTGRFIQQDARFKRLQGEWALQNQQMVSKQKPVLLTPLSRLTSIAGPMPDSSGSIPASKQHIRLSLLEPLPVVPSLPVAEQSDEVVSPVFKTAIRPAQLAPLSKRALTTITKPVSLPVAPLDNRTIEEITYSSLTCKLQRKYLLQIQVAELRVDLAARKQEIKDTEDRLRGRSALKRLEAFLVCNNAMLAVRNELSAVEEELRILQVDRELQKFELSSTFTENARLTLQKKLVAIGLPDVLPVHTAFSLYPKKAEKMVDLPKQKSSVLKKAMQQPTEEKELKQKEVEQKQVEPLAELPLNNIMQQPKPFLRAHSRSNPANKKIQPASKEPIDIPAIRMARHPAEELHKMPAKKVANKKAEFFTPKLPVIDERRPSFFDKAHRIVVSRSKLPRIINGCRQGRSEFRA